MESYHKDRKRDKFDYAIFGIFACSIIVSFTHTIQLYESAGFDIPIGWMNNSLTEQWFGEGFFNLALFATLAAEAAFSVGLWGLFEAFRIERKFPGWRYTWTWGMFIGGLVVIGWSNIGATLGTNYLFGNPVKGFVLGLSIPYFVLNAVLVNFSRALPADQTKNEQPEQPKLTLWAASIANAVNTFREITKKPEHEHVQRHEQLKAEQTNHEHEHTRTSEHEQHEHTHLQQPERQQNEQPDHEQNKRTEHERSEHEQINPEQADDEQPQREQSEQKDEQAEREQTEQRKQSEREQRKRKLYIVNGSGQSKVEQAVQCALKMMERNEQFTVRELARMAGCSVATAQNALNRLKQQKRA